MRTSTMRLSLIVLGAALAAPLAAQAATIHVNYIGDDPNTGFLDPTPVAAVGGNAGTTRGQQRKNALEFGLARWAERLSSNVTIEYNANFQTFTSSDCDASGGTLGQAGPNMVASSSPPAPLLAFTFYPLALANALTNADQGGATPDIDAHFNPFVDSDASCLGGAKFYYGLDHNPGTKIDFLNVVMHETGHGLGFTSGVDPTDGSVSQSAGHDIFAIYDHFLFDETSGQFWTAMTNSQRATSAINTGHLVWNGSHTNTGSNGFLTAGRTGAGHVRMFAPNPLQNGSSVSHWDDVATPNLLMEPALTSDIKGSQKTDLTTCAFQDIGWSLLAPFGCPDTGGVGNTPPTITQIANQTINVNTNTGALAFTVGDAETAAGSLTVSGSSSNTALVPNNPANITFGGSGANRTLTVTPASGQTGTATITYQVSDGTSNTSKNFTLTVNGPNTAPTSTQIANQTINEDGNTGALAFTVGDAETAAGSLTVSGGSSNTTLVPNGNIVFGGSGANRTVTVTPAANQSGTATITYSVSDGSISTIKTFTLTVTAVNDPPTISSIANRSIAVGSSTGAIAFTVNDVDNNPNSLTVSGSSSNQALVPNANIVFGGSGTNRTVTVTPAAQQVGAATITVTVSDGTASTPTNFQLTVSANTAPTIAPISSFSVLEDAAQQTVSLSGISAGSGETQTITITASSANPALIPDPTVVYTSPNSTGSLKFTPVANQNGSAVITVTVKDNGGTASGGVDTTTRTFTVTVVPVNDAPTLDAISNRSIPTSAPQQVVNLTGISAGPSDEASQVVTVTASSSNPALIPDPAVTYTSPNSTGTLTFTPAAGQTGSSFVTVTVHDDGAKLNGGVNTTTRTFTVTVGGGNQPPVANNDSFPAINENSSNNALNVLGNDTDPDGDTLTITNVSVPNHGGAAVPANGNTTISYTPASGFTGTETFTYTISDGHSHTANATVTVTVNAVGGGNTPPTSTQIAPQTISEDGNTGALAFTVGDAETATASLTVSGGSSNQALVPNANVVLGGSGASRTVTVTPAPNQNGSATITYSVSDGTATTSKTFTLTVTPVNDAPTIDAIASPGPIAPGASQSVNLTGISAGGGETQTLTVTASSSNPSVVPDPIVTYTSPNSTGSLLYSGVAGQAGTATITVTVHDDGGTDNGGVDTTTRTFSVAVNSVSPPPSGGGGGGSSGGSFGFGALAGLAAFAALRRRRSGPAIG